MPAETMPKPAADAIRFSRETVDANGSGPPIGCADGAGTAGRNGCAH